jgi:hypothetical protein
MFPLTAGSAPSVWVESAIVAVTGLIAVGLGRAVLLLFLTVVTFAKAQTLAAAFYGCGPQRCRVAAGGEIAERVAELPVLSLRCASFQYL